MNLRHLLTQSLACLLLTGLCVGFGGCKPEDATTPATDGETGTQDEAADDAATDDTDAATGTDAATDASGDAADTTDGGPEIPVEAPMPTGDDPAPVPPQESGSSTNDGAAAKIPSVQEAGSVTEVPADKIPGTSTPEAGSSTK